MDGWIYGHFGSWVGVSTLPVVAIMSKNHVFFFHAQNILDQYNTELLTELTTGQIAPCIRMHFDVYFVQY